MSFREILQSFRDISQATQSDKMTVTIKGLQKDGSDDLNEVNVNQKLRSIEQTIQSYDTATALNVFKNEKGPNNARNMEWPAFKGIQSAVVIVYDSQIIRYAAYFMFPIRNIWEL